MDVISWTAGLWSQTLARTHVEESLASTLYTDLSRCNHEGRQFTVFISCGLNWSPRVCFVYTYYSWMLTIGLTPAIPHGCEVRLHQIETAAHQPKGPKPLERLTTVTSPSVNPPITGFPPDNSRFQHRLNGMFPCDPHRPEDYANLILHCLSFSAHHLELLSDGPTHFKPLLPMEPDHFIDLMLGCVCRSYITC